MPDLNKHLHGLPPLDNTAQDTTKQTDVWRMVSNPNPNPGEAVTVTVSPLGFDTHYFGIEGFIMTKPNMSFKYEVIILDTAKSGDQYHIQGTHWNNPLGREGLNPSLITQTKETVLVVSGAPSVTSVPQMTPTKERTPNVGNCRLPSAGGGSTIYASWLLLPAPLGILSGRNFIIAGLRLSRQRRQK